MTTAPPSSDDVAKALPVEKDCLRNALTEHSLHSAAGSGNGAVYNRRSTIDFKKLDEKSSIFRGEDSENVQLTLNAVKKSDLDGDGKLDIDEIGLTILSAVKEAKKASKKEKKLKLIIGGLGGFVFLFGIIFLVVQGVALSQSIEETKITSVNEDDYGNAKLQDADGSDLSTRSFGDKIPATSKLDIYSGRMLHCTSVSNVATMTNDATNGVEANVVVMTDDGLPAAGFSLAGQFTDEKDALSYANGNLRVDLASDACFSAASTPDDDDLDDTDSGSARRLALRGNREFLAPEEALARNRGRYESAMAAHREGRKLTDDGEALLNLPPWDEDKCAIDPADNAQVKASTDSIACPAMRYLVKRALQSDFFELCGYGSDSYMVDTTSMKALLQQGISYFKGLQRDQTVINDSLTSMDVFHGAIDGQSTGVLKHSSSEECIDISNYEYNADAGVSPGTTIGMSASCSGNRQRWKLKSSTYNAAIKIHHRRSSGFCLSRNAANDGVELAACSRNSNWKLDPDGRIREFGGDDYCLTASQGGVTLADCDSSDDSQVWVPPPILNAAHLENNFDHSASTGIIGSATADDTDNVSFNRAKFDEFLGQLCDCNISTLDAVTYFDPSDVGRAVNHFGAAISDAAVRDSTQVGAFSWAILAFEYANLYDAFKDGAGIPQTTIKSLFLPDADLIAEGLLEEGNIVPHIARDIKPAGTVHQLRDTILAMNINITSDVKAAMDDEVASCTCDDTPDCGACGFHNLFTVLCGDGYTDCLLGDA